MNRDQECRAMSNNNVNDLNCPFCGSKRIAYEGMYKMAKTAGIVMLPESAFVFRCRSCKKLFFFHGQYKHEANRLKIDVKEWRNKLGDDLFTCLIILCIGLNRLYALLDLLHFSDRFDRTRSTARHDRNYVSALIITFGILHELDRNLDSMCGYITVKNGQVNEAIRELKQIYNKDSKMRAKLTKYRNKMSNHFDQDIIKNELNVGDGGDIGFMKYDSQIDRDVYYEFEEISNMGFIRQFFTDEIEHYFKQGKAFEEAWPLIFDEFLKYVTQVHFDTMKKGHALVSAYIKEYDLKVKEDSQIDIGNFNKKN